MRDKVTKFVQACPTYQKNRRETELYGHLPPKEAEAEIWYKMCVDLIDPYRIRRKGNQT